MANFQFPPRAYHYSVGFVRFKTQLLRVDGWFLNCVSGLREPLQSRLTFPYHLGFLSFQLCTTFVAYFGNTVSAALTSSLLIASSRQTFLMRLLFITWALTFIQGNLQLCNYQVEHSLKKKNIIIINKRKKKCRFAGLF